VTLLELAERCEAATGPSYALDLEIAAAIYPVRPRVLQIFTASIDAALMLVPDLDGWVVMGNGAKVGRWVSPGATPALALCAAALRARHEMENPA